MSLLVTLVAVVVAVAGGTTVYTLLGEDGTGAGRSRDRVGSTGARSGQEPPDGRAPDHPRPPRSPSPSAVTEVGDLPEEYLGTWEVALGTAETDVRRFTLGQGELGDPVFRLDADGPGYHCEFSATLRSAGPPVELSASAVEVAQPATACLPGPVTTLELGPDGRLRRVFADSDEKPLTYTRVDRR
ncbi:hypothetical protein [Streptomyces zingiberis]|uniref:Serine/threonine protein kinase n=1 Tax=Streptomyces zingiberis TaxID=2053010 RepID=A0ABX1BNW6_9ACTN|nr:hypothetical protein [Streptomyces zingiberis]NJP99401.1 hypothetical protein [Streptomyces zingiberis]